MDVYLSINNREQVIKLPVTPSEFTVPTPQNNETYTTISQGDIRLIGLTGLKTIIISSFFPNKEYAFAKDTTYGPWDYVYIIEKWMERRMPIRLIMTDTPINIAMTIDNFEHGVKDGTGDVYYTLTLSEFKFVNLTKRSV